MTSINVKNIQLNDSFYELVFIKDGLKAYRSDYYHNNNFTLIFLNDTWVEKIFAPINSTGNCQFNVFEDFRGTIDAIMNASDFTFEQAVDYYLELIITIQYDSTLMYLHLCQYNFEPEELEYIKSHRLFKIVSCVENIETRESTQVHILVRIVERSSFKKEALPENKLYLLKVYSNSICFKQKVYHTANIADYLHTLYLYINSMQIKLFNEEGYAQKALNKHLNDIEGFYTKLADELNKNKLDSDDITFVL
jgi:hypothetical protein